MWKTMEAAPKDGTHILTCSPKHSIIETWWKQDILGDWGWGGNGWSYASWQPPTHWMPIPDLPDFSQQ